MKRVCGLDVHKDSIFCATFNGKKHGEVKEYSTLTSSIKSMGEILLSDGIEAIAMESTSIYWIPVWNILEEMGFKLMLVNPYLIKQMPGRKSDIKDAQWIATLLYKGLLRASLVPSKEIRELRSYSRKYVKLQQKQTSILTEMENVLEQVGIRITSYVSNISGKSILKVIQHIVDGKYDPSALTELIHGRIINKHKKDVITESLSGFIKEHHRFSLELSLQLYELLIKQSEKCLMKMEKVCDQYYKKEKELLLTIPGISHLAAMIIIAESGADMKAFENSRKFSGWTGLRPRNDESAGKYKSTATTKGNRYLRTILVQIAWASTRIKGSFFKESFNRISIRKSSKKALIAIARKMGVLIWNVLFFEKAFDPKMKIIYDPNKLQLKKHYHQKEIIKIERLLLS
jgi:transposase